MTVKTEKAAEAEAAEVAKRRLSIPLTADLEEEVRAVAAAAELPPLRVCEIITPEVFGAIRGRVRELTKSALQAELNARFQE